MFKKLFATPQHGMSDEDYGNLMRYQTNFITVLFITLSICLFAYLPICSQHTNILFLWP